MLSGYLLIKKYFGRPHEFIHPVGDVPLHHPLHRTAAQSSSHSPSHSHPNHSKSVETQPSITSHPLYR